MAVTAEQLKGRVRALYPNANLSTDRMSKLADRLCKKPKDDATDDEIDEVIKDFNDFSAMTFEEIAKSDDRLRTLEAEKKPKLNDPPKENPPKPDPDEPAWFKAHREATDARLAKMESDKTKETVVSKFASDERVKNIPDFIRKGYTPSSDEDYESKVTELVEAYKPFAESNKLAGFNGEDAPSSSTGGKEAANGKVKPLTVEQTKGIADSI